MTEPGRPQSPQQNTRAGEFQQAWQGEFQQPQYWQEPQQNPWQEPPMNQMGERNAVESARRSYSRIGASFSVMIVVWMALVFVLGIGISMLHREAAHWMWVSLLVSDCSFYLVAVPLAYLMLRSVPEEPTRKFGMTFGELFEWFLVSLAIVFVGGLLGNALAALFSGGMAQNRLDNIVGGIPAWLNILAVVVVGPIVEEWLCRKQIIARVRRYGERLAIVVSALVFALFHLNLYQFFYAFGLGLVLGYIYMRTSQLKYTIGLHMAINFLGSVVGAFFSDWSDAHSAALDAGDVSNGTRRGRGRHAVHSAVFGGRGRGRGAAHCEMPQTRVLRHARATAERHCLLVRVRQRRHGRVHHADGVRHGVGAYERDVDLPVSAPLSSMPTNEDAVKFRLSLELCTARAMASDSAVSATPCFA